MRLRPYLPLKTVKAVWFQSWTKLWAYLQLAGASVLGIATELNTYLANDTINSYLHALSVPNWVFIGIAVLGLVTFIAHGRSDA